MQAPIKFACTVIKSVTVFMCLVTFSKQSFSQWMLINENGGQPNSSAALEVTSTNRGVLVPRLSTIQMNAVTSPANGLLIYNTDSSKFFFYNGSIWGAIVGSSSSSDTLGIIKDADNDTKIQVEKTVDEDKIRIDVAGTEYFVLDTGRIEFLNNGQSVFLGELAGYNDDGTNNQNVFLGYDVGRTNTTGQRNLMAGAFSGNLNTTGSANTFLGWGTAANNTTGGSNVFIGANSGTFNSTGVGNTFLGVNSGYSNTTGNNNVMIGRNAGFYDTLGSSNVMIGYFAGENETGSNKLYISNNNSSTPLIYGDFSSDSMRFNANNMVLSSNTVGSATLTIEADKDDDNNDDVPAIKFLQDGGGTEAFIGLNGSSDQILTDASSNDLLIGHWGNEGIQFFVDSLFRLSLKGGSNGYAGVGTASPEYDWHVVEEIGDNASLAIETEDASGDAYMKFKTRGTDFRIEDNGLDDRLYFENDDNERILMSIEDDGKVGIGLENPEEELHVLDSSGTADFRVETRDNSSTVSMYLESPKREWRLVNDVDGKLRVMDDGNNETFMVFDTLGYIGINDFGPDAELEVGGRIITDTLEVDGEYTLPWEDGNNNDVLTTNGSGVVSWQAPAISPWTLDNDTVSVAGKYVGIGTTNPTAELHVQNNSGQANFDLQSITNSNTSVISLKRANNGESIVSSSNVFGSIKGLGFDGSGYSEGARIVLAADGNPGVGDMPGKITFNTSPDGTSVPVARMVIKNDGKIGIGTSSPSEELDVEGEIQIDGDYKYESAKTKYLPISNAAFVYAGTNSAVRANRDLISGFNVRVRTSGGNAANDAKLNAPVNLPDGAVVTSLRAVVFDANATYTSNIRLVRQLQTSTTATTMAVASTTGSGGVQTITDNTISNSVIDNEDYVYFLQFETKEATTTLALYSVRITYTITKAE